MLSIRISQHFNYKPLFSGFVYLNWMNLVLLKVSAYDPQARAPHVAQPHPGVLISVWATGPEPGCPSHAGSGSSGHPSPPVPPAPALLPRSPVRLLSCSVIPSQLLSPNSLPPPTPALPGRRFPAAAFCRFLTFAQSAQGFTGLKTNKYFCCVLRVTEAPGGEGQEGKLLRFGENLK